jgi:hypothetical protein
MRLGQILQSERYRNKLEDIPVYGHIVPAVGCARHQPWINHEFGIRPFNNHWLAKIILGKNGISGPVWHKNFLSGPAISDLIWLFIMLFKALLSTVMAGSFSGVEECPPSIFTVRVTDKLKGNLKEREFTEKIHTNLSAIRLQFPTVRRAPVKFMVSGLFSSVRFY